MAAEWDNLAGWGWKKFQIEEEQTTGIHIKVLINENLF